MENTQSLMHLLTNTRKARQTNCTSTLFKWTACRRRD